MRSRFRLVVLALDLAIITAVSFAAAELRKWLPMLPDATDDVRRLVVPVIPFLISLWMLALLLGGAYRPRHWGTDVTEYRQVLNSSVSFLLVVSLLAFLFNYPLSRIFVALLFLLGCTASAIKGRTVSGR